MWSNFTILFFIHIHTFTESQTHNTCLNRKLCIDADGNIENCPILENINDTTLQEFLTLTGFKDIWYINKDKIDVCKNCEFKYMCNVKSIVRKQGLFRIKKKSVN
jgi:radical SAM protein with 4Fe4S-binding SPASM domain